MFVCLFYSSNCWSARKCETGWQDDVHVHLIKKKKKCKKNLRKKLATHLCDHNFHMVKQGWLRDTSQTTVHPWPILITSACTAGDAHCHISCNFSLWYLVYHLHRASLIIACCMSTDYNMWLLYYKAVISSVHLISYSCGKDIHKSLDVAFSLVWHKKWFGKVQQHRIKAKQINLLCPFVTLWCECVSLWSHLSEDCGVKRHML